MRVGGRLIRGPVRPDRWSALRLVSLRWAALPIVDRRWTVPMAAVALGFGLFVGVAIGPGTEGTLGTSAPMLVKVPAPDSQAPGAVASAAAHAGGGKGGGDVSGANNPLPAAPTPSASSEASLTPSTGSTGSTPLYPSAPSYPTYPTTGATGIGTDASATTQTALGTVLSGTVVHLNPKAASYTIAAEDKRLLAIHSDRLPDPGDQVSVAARSLANGTYDEEGDRDRNGNRRIVRFTGTVSDRDPASREYTVSAAGVSLLVQGPANGAPPSRGDRVEVQGLIVPGPDKSEPAPEPKHGCGQPPRPPRPAESSLRQLDVTVTDTATPGAEARDASDFEGIVQGVCRNDRELILSADDVRESGADLTLDVPSEISMGKLEPGQVLRLAGVIHDNGSYEVKGLASDERAKGADDEKLIRGEL